MFSWIAVISASNSRTPASISNPLFFRVYQHKLDKNYSEHKNYGKSLCKGKYIFQIDADELPSKILLDNLKEIIELNNDRILELEKQMDGLDMI